MSSDSEITSMGGCLARMIWVIAGPVLLLAFAFIIASSQPGPIIGVLDLIYVGLLAVVIFARFLDRPPKAKAEEYKAGSDSALKYIATLSFCAVGLWLLAHFVLKNIL